MAVSALTVATFGKCCSKYISHHQYKRGKSETYVVDHTVSTADCLFERHNLVCSGEVLHRAHGNGGVRAEEGYEVCGRGGVAFGGGVEPVKVSGWPLEMVLCFGRTSVGMWSWIHVLDRDVHYVCHCDQGCCPGDCFCFLCMIGQSLRMEIKWKKN